MKNAINAKSLWLAARLGLVLLVGVAHSPGADQENPQDKPKDKPQAPPARSVASPSSAPSQTAPVPSLPNAPARRQSENIRPPPKTREPAQTTKTTSQPAQPRAKQSGLRRDTPNPKEPPEVRQPGAKTIRTGNSSYKEVTASGRTIRSVVKERDGQHIQTFNPAGRVQQEEVRKQDGTLQTTLFAPNGKPRLEVVVRHDGNTQTTNFHYDRDGNERAKETVNTDARGRPVSKTVVVRQTTIIRNTTIKKNSEIVMNYDPGRFGFVYRPAYVEHPRVFVSWYNPRWYTPAGVLIVHPFHYVWGWENYGWYHRYHGPYWATYDVYPAPCYWLTDWVIGGYLADNYAASISVAQAQEEVRLAQQDAANARQAAAKATDEAEIAEAKRAQAEAELRAKNAEERVEKTERQETSTDKANPNATPIDQETKEVLRNQIEKTIAEKKEFAEQSEKGGNPVVPDVFKALADPNHVYPVSKTIGVTRAEDSKPAGILTTGDLLKLEPGQGALKETTANENTFVTMRVMTSKGEADAVPAGTLISVPLGDLQEFDNEFRAKLDLGLAEAEKNEDLFKRNAVAK